MPFTLRNIKEDLEDVGSRFDGAPDLEWLNASWLMPPELARMIAEYDRVVSV